MIWLFCVTFTGIRKTNSHVSRSSRDTKESRLLRGPHTSSIPGSFLRFSKWKLQHHDVTWRSYTQRLVYWIVTSCGTLRHAALDHFIKRADRHKEIKMFKKKPLCDVAPMLLQRLLPSCLKRWIVTYTKAVSVGETHPLWRRKVHEERQQAVV